MERLFTGLTLVLAAVSPSPLPPAPPQPFFSAWAEWQENIDLLDNFLLQLKRTSRLVMWLSLLGRNVEDRAGFEEPEVRPTRATEEARRTYLKDKDFKQQNSKDYLNNLMRK